MDEKGAPPPAYSDAGYAPPPAAPGYAGGPPPQGGYAPPPQGGYPPPQGGYPPPQQGGYPPPQQGGYPAQPAGYAPPPAGYAQQPQGYAQPGAGGYPQQPAPPPGQIVSPVSTTVIVQGGRIGGGYGRNPVNMVCPHCAAQVVTATEHSIGSASWIVVGIVALIGLFFCPLILLGCCFIPLCVPSLKDVEHSCPNCRKFLGSYKHNL